MKNMIILGLVFALFLGFGCLNSTPAENNAPDCTIVTKSVPEEKIQCGNFSYTEQVCENLAIPYQISTVDKSDLCTDTGNCFGENFSSCSPCQSATTRCSMTITNTDPLYSGDFVVGASFGSNGLNVSREPLRKRIQFNSSEKFDFYYSYGSKSLSRAASCDVFVISSPMNFGCHQETRTREECKNVTETKLVQSEVCK